MIEDEMKTFPLCWLAVAPVLLITVSSSGIFAEDKTATNFLTIITEQNLETFERVAKYVGEHVDAADSEQAWRWLFVAALEHGFETRAVDLARGYIKSPSASAATRGIAQQTLAIGLAKSGQSEEAVQLFTGQLRFARFQSGGALIEFGRRLATQLRIARDFAAARHVYEEISSKFFLNAEVRGLCENRIKKIDLIDEPAPEIEATDISGAAVSLSSLQGKVVLVDFWATNCPPCLEEMPNIKQLYAKHHDNGFEVVGVSLDGDSAIVEEFTGRTEISWPMIVDDRAVTSLRTSYHVPTIPALFVVDRSGKIHQFDVRGRDLQQVIENLLKQ